MQKSIKISVILLLIIGGKVNFIFAQHTLIINKVSEFNAHQDSLQIISDSTFATNNNEERFKMNALFIKKLEQVLKLPNSFNFDFDSLKNVSILNAPDQSFRIITWFVPTTFGTYNFFGSIQVATADGKLKLIPLTDKTEDLTDANVITNNKNWYGARYYEILPVTSPNKLPYYLLLGWKGNDLRTSKKVIEVLSFDKGEAIFGKNIFEVVKNQATKNRVIFEYNKLNTMTLIFDRKVNLLVFDHLAPYNPNMVGNFEYYGSDLSFDGYKISYGKLNLLEDIELKNDAAPQDDFYNSPIKKTDNATKNKP